MNKSIFISNLMNLRPYSWIDLLFIGLVAKVSVEKSFSFDIKDIAMLIGLLSLWYFYNLLLEWYKAREYRSKPNLIITFSFLALGIILGLIYSPLTLIFSISSVFFVLLYLLKNKVTIFGISSPIVRGIIQSQYYLYALLFYSKNISNADITLSVLIFLMSASRALIGDLRDIVPDSKTNKNTFPVIFGVQAAIVLIVILFLASIIIFISAFQNYLAGFPLILMIIAVMAYKNGYVLHQLMIIATTFVSVNLIALLLGDSLILFNLIFLGIFTNLIFYPLLSRKSNPIFSSQNLSAKTKD